MPGELLCIDLGHTQVVEPVPPGEEQRVRHTGIIYLKRQVIRLGMRRRGGGDVLTLAGTDLDDEAMPVAPRRAHEITVEHEPVGHLKITFATWEIQQVAPGIAIPRALQPVVESRGPADERFHRMQPTHLLAVKGTPPVRFAPCIQHAVRSRRRITRGVRPGDTAGPGFLTMSHGFHSLFLSSNIPYPRDNDGGHRKRVMQYTRTIRHACVHSCARVILKM